MSFSSSSSLYSYFFNLPLHTHNTHKKIRYIYFFK